MRRSIQQIRFTWDLRKVPTGSVALPAKHEIKLQPNPDVGALWEGIQRSFLNEKSWIVGLEAHLDELRKKTFPEGKPVAGMEVLVLAHGSRVIGVSALQPKAGEEPQLLSGIILDYEYQRRGLGVALLQASLRHLAEKGLETASVITREGIPAARYLYPKFGGQGSVIDSKISTGV
jgi:ribosomal protein S18 acetylase RimI-like enzyme